MSDFTAKIDQLIAKYKGMSPEEFLEYFADKVEAKVSSSSLSLSYRETAIDEPIEEDDVEFLCLEVFPAELSSYYSANDDEYAVEYSLCA